MKTILIAVLSLFLANAVYSQENKIYVWDFADRNGQRSDLTTSLTDEFEEALQFTECCKILQRRDYARLFSQRENEVGIIGIQNIPTEQKDRLKDLRAESVVFGEVFDDTNSGQFKISVSVEDFSGEILRSASVYMAKYNINNPQKRIEAVKELVDKLKFAPNTSKPIETKTVGEWTFSLTGCQRIGKDIQCGYTVTSNYRDRTFTMSYLSTAYDEYGYQYALSSHKLANKSVVGSNGIRTLLIDGVETSGFLRFDNVSSRANKFTLLVFSIGGEDLSTNKLEFRNVEFE